MKKTVLMLVMVMVGSVGCVTLEVKDSTQTKAMAGTLGRHQGAIVQNRKNLEAIIQGQMALRKELEQMKVIQSSVLQDVTTLKKSVVVMPPKNTADAPRVEGKVEPSQPDKEGQ